MKFPQYHHCRMSLVIENISVFQSSQRKILRLRTLLGGWRWAGHWTQILVVPGMLSAPSPSGRVCHPSVLRNWKIKMRGMKREEITLCPDLWKLAWYYQQRDLKVNSCWKDFAGTALKMLSLKQNNLLRWVQKSFSATEFTDVFATSHF